MRKKIKHRIKIKIPVSTRPTNVETPKVVGSTVWGVAVRRAFRISLNRLRHPGDRCKEIG